MNLDRTNDQSWGAILGSLENWKGSQRQHEIYVVDIHREHSIPTMKDVVSIQQIWDNYRVDDVFEDAGFDEEKRKELIKIVFEKRAAAALVEGRLAFDLEEERLETAMENNVWEIRFYRINDQSDTEFHAMIQDWLDKFEIVVTKAITEAGGDDDFFDYMPNFVDIFRQACELLGCSEQYNACIKPFLGVESEGGCVYEFYVDSI